MTETKIAKLFNSGSSQTVQLPAGFQFEGTQVYATRDDVTGEIVLSHHPGAKAWQDFFEMMDSMDIPPDFMTDRPLNRTPQERDLFSEES